MRETLDPRSRSAWRCVWIQLVAVALVAVLSFLKLGNSTLASAVARNLTSALLLVGWLASVRFVLLDTWGRWLFIGVLVSSLVATQFENNGGLVLAIILACLALMSRTLRCWALVSARRRAIGFGMGILALVVLFGSTGVWSTEAQDETPWSALDKLGVWSLAGFMAFWFLSLLHLTVRMRLHFLRLRPKLLVSSFLVGFVPLVLVCVLGTIILYTSLGGSRALRATNIMDSWRDLAASGNDMAGAPFDTTFCWPDPCAVEAWSGNVVIEPVAGIANLAEFVPSRADTTAWFILSGDVWLMRWEARADDLSVQAWLLGDRSLKYLSRMVMAGVEVANLGANPQGGGIQFEANNGLGMSMFAGRRACYREISEDSSFWKPWRIFGGALLPINHVRRGELDGSSLVVNLRVGWRDLEQEFFEGEGNLNVVVVAALLVVGFLFLIIEIFAFFFGVRISEGIVRAVHSLHKGTRTLAAGKLDTVIAIPNEDEFGDLADSFNEMTVALAQGRKDALAKERLTRELETAREIQERLLPREELTAGGFQITGASIPSREIGGDYFDFILRGQDSIGVAIGDVSGKGMPAALLMSNLQASLHGQVIHPSSVAVVVGLVNDLLVKSTDPHMFATFFYGLLDTSAGTFTCTNAGHNPPMLLRTDGSLEKVHTGGLLLGMLANQKYRQQTVNMEPGDVMVLYTDGITEAIGPHADEDDIDAMFGEEALENVVRQHQHLPAVGVKEAILKAVARHTEGHAQSDDITLVVIRRQA